jgi:hypothetical protein
MLVGIGLAPSRAMAQRVTGTVSDTRAGAPLAGAVVSAIAAGGSAVGQALTDRQGRFTIVVADSVRSLLVRKIGFQPRTVALGDAQRAGTAAVEVGLAPVPQVLDAVVSNGSCPASPTARQAAALWEQARTGFLATVVARDAAPAQLRVMRVEREYEDGIRGSAVRAVTVKDAISVRTFTSARRPQDFAATGYVTITADHRVIDAPDADVLLDQSFSDTHCFSLAAPDRAHPRQVGIVFQPVRGREQLVDVRGVLWLDASPLALSELTFTFVGGRGPTKAVGSGRIHFDVAANGIVVVDEWSMITDATLTGDRARPVSGRLEVTGYLTSVRWTDGTLLQAPLSTVAGTVIDKDTKQPARDIVVGLAGTGFATKSDHMGRFSIPSVPPGSHELLFDDAWYDAFKIRRESPMGLTVERGRDVSLRVERRLPARIARDACDVQELGNGKGTVVVRIVDRRGAAVYQQVAMSAALDAGGQRFADSWRTDGGPISICRVAAGMLTISVQDDVFGMARGRVRVSGGEGLDTLTVVIGSRNDQGQYSVSSRK